MALKMAGPMLGGFYNSPGDDPTAGIEGELERPVTSVPICEADQHIMTLPGEAPPGLFDNGFPELGQKKSIDGKAFRTAMSEMIFEAGETHTFAYWGPSQAVDLIKWQLVGLPMLRGTSLDILNGPPPVLVTAYVLKPGHEQETRHLESRKDVLWQVAGWSSNYRPTPERLQELEVSARGKADKSCAQLSPSTKPCSEVRQFVRQAKNPLARSNAIFCCGEGIQKLIGALHGISA